MAGISLILFLFTFFLYTAGLAPAIPPRDSGELIAVSNILGIPHPPGYPLYTFLGRLFSLIPLGNPAYRVNLLSAFFGSLSIALMFLLFGKLSFLQPNNPPFLKIPLLEKSGGSALLRGDGVLGVWGLLPALLITLFIALNPVYLAECGVAEVFTLNILFLLLILLSLCRENIKITAVVFLFALAMSNHHTIILALPAMIYFFLKSKPNVGQGFSLAGAFNLLYRNLNTRNLKVAAIKGQGSRRLQPALNLESNLKTIAIAAAVGLSPYIYIFLRSFHNPAIDWGKASEGIGNFLSIITRKSYGTLSLHPEMSAGLSFMHIVKQAFIFLEVYLSSFGWLFTALLFASLLKLVLHRYFNMRNLKVAAASSQVAAGFSLRNCSVKEMNKWAAAVFIGFLFSGPFFILISRMPLADYAQSMLDRFYLMSFIFAGLIIVSSGGKILLTIFLSAGLALNAIFLYGTGSGNRNNFIAYDFGRNIERSLGRSSDIFVRGDSPFFISLSLKEAFGNFRDNIIFSENMPEWRVSQYVRRFGLEEELLNHRGKGFVSEYAGRYAGRKKIYTTGIPESFFSGNEVIHKALVNEITPAKRGSVNSSELHPELQFARNKGGFRGLSSPELSLPGRLLDLSEGERLFLSSYIMRGRYIPEEYRFFEKEIVKQYSSAYNLLATGYAFGKRYSDALRMVEKAARMERDSAEIYVNWGSVLYLSGDTGGALEKYLISNGLNPGLADTYSNIGAIYGRRKEYDRALFYFQKALEKNPGLAEARDNINLIRQLQKK